MRERPDARGIHVRAHAEHLQVQGVGKLLGIVRHEIAQQAEFTPKEVHMKDERVKLVFGVKVRIDNPEGYLKPGMPVDVRIKWQDDVPW